MAYNDRKILGVLKDEIGNVPDRCEGYRDDLKHLIGDVLILEHEHAISKINIVQKIANQVNTVGINLHKMRTAAEHRKEGKK